MGMSPQLSGTHSPMGRLNWMPLPGLDTLGLGSPEHVLQESKEPENIGENQLTCELLTQIKHINK